jgi:alkylated DNA nucleotide flippase Atl1
LKHGLLEHFSHGRKAVVGFGFEKLIKNISGGPSADREGPLHHNWNLLVPLWLWIIHQAEFFGKVGYRVAGCGCDRVDGIVVVDKSEEVEHAVEYARGATLRRQTDAPIRWQQAIARAGGTARFKSRVVAVLAAIPEGRVTTYGIIARHLHVTARQVAFILATLTVEESRRLPWFRGTQSGPRLVAGTDSEDRIGRIGLGSGLPGPRGSHPMDDHSSAS